VFKSRDETELFKKVVGTESIPIVGRNMLAVVFRAGLRLSATGFRELLQKVCFLSSF
jgi:hypothetical protein